MLRNMIDRFVGRGEAAVTVPPMDGALRPNQALEQAAIAAEARAPDNLVNHRGNILFSTGRELRKLGADSVVHSFDRSITCLAAAPDGHLAVGLSGGEVVIVAPDGAVNSLPAAETSHATALAFHDDALIVCRGSTRHSVDQWKRDLMEAGTSAPGSGSVVLIPRAGPPRILADGLRWPYGAWSHQGRIIVSESWSHRLLALDPAGGTRPQTVLTDLPGYPARLSAASDGTAWAVGCTSCNTKNSVSSQTLILRWNGTAWTRVPSPSPGPSSYLESVAVAPDGTAWAVGWTDSPSYVLGTLIMEWNGTEWTTVQSPDTPRCSMPVP